MTSSLDSYGMLKARGIAEIKMHSLGDGLEIDFKVRSEIVNLSFSTFTCQAQRRGEAECKTSRQTYFFFLFFNSSKTTELFQSLSSPIVKKN